MSEMVERVARALCRRQCPSEPGSHYLDANWPRFEDDARTAIAAMRQPTDAMEFIGDAIWRSAFPTTRAFEAYVAMIDAALSGIVIEAPRQA